MPRIFILLVALLFSHITTLSRDATPLDASYVRAEDQSSLAGTQVLTSFNHTINNGGKMDYYLYYPQGFDVNQSNGSVLIALHGNAERGGNPTRMLNSAGEGSIVKMINEGAHLPLMVVSPHQDAFVGGVNSPNWNMAQLKQLVQHLISDLQVDPNRIYMTGFSGGGQGVWQYAVAYPEDLAAMTVLAGITDLSGQVFNVNLQQAPYPCSIDHIPTKVWHGNNDNTINRGQSINMVNAINNCVPTPDPEASLNLLPGVGHSDLRGLIYANISGQGNMYDWLMSFSKGGANDQEPPVFTGNSPIVSDITETSLKIFASINEPGTIVYGVYQDGSTPSVSDVDNRRGAGFVSGRRSTSMSRTFNINNLAPGTNYDIFLFAQDNMTPVNVQQSLTLVEATTLITDSEPPAFLESPFVSELNPGMAEVELQLDKPGTIFWALTIDGSIQPSIDDVFSSNAGIQSGIVSSTGNVENLLIDGLINSTAYTLYLIAEDEETPPNQQASLQVLDFETLSSSQGSGSDKVINVNFVSNSFDSGLPDWNDAAVNNFNGLKTFNSLTDETGNSTAISLITINGENASSWLGVSNNRAGLSGGIYPDNVTNYAAYTSGTGKMYFDNLDGSKLYTVVLYGGRSGKSPRITRYTVENQSQTLDCINNKTEVRTFQDVSPNGLNRINIQFSKETSWAYVNSVVLKEQGGSFSDVQAPSAPLSLSGTNTNDEVQLDWQDNTESDFSSYNIYRSTVQNFTPNVSYLISGGVDFSVYEDNNIEANTNYYYKVTALDFSGNESGPSEEVDILQNVVDNDPPVSPGNVTATTLGSDQITLDWSDNSEPDFEAYNVFRGLVSGFAVDASNQVATIVSQSEYTDTGLDAEVTYYYLVTAIDTAGNESMMSVEVSATTDAITSATAVNAYQLNFLGNNHSTGLSDWYDINLQDISGERIFSPNNINGDVTSMRLRAISGINGSTISGIVNNSNALNNGVFPNQVLRFGAYSSGTAKLFLTDLAAQHFYTLTIHGGRAGSASRITDYAVNNVVQSLECIDNNTNTVVFENVRPNANGQISVTISGQNVWAYINGMTIEEFSDATLVNGRLGTIQNETHNNTIPLENEINNLLVYPNPSDGVFHLKYYSGSSDPVEVKIFDKLGRRIYSKTFGNVVDEYITIRGGAGKVFFLQLFDRSTIRNAKIILK